MIFLLDTKAFSDLMSGQAQIVNRVDGISSEDRVIICSIIRGEIQFGIERLPESIRRRELEIKVSEVYTAFPCEPVPEEAGDHYARIIVVPIYYRCSRIALVDSTCKAVAQGNVGEGFKPAPTFDKDSVYYLE